MSLHPLQCSLWIGCLNESLISSQNILSDLGLILKARFLTYINIQYIIVIKSWKQNLLKLEYYCEILLVFF